MISEKDIQIMLSENKYRLLGQIEVSDKDFEELLVYAQNKAAHLYVTAVPRADLLLSVTLVQVAIRYYQEGKYWQCFREALGMDLPSSRLNYIGQIFSRTLRNYGLLEIKREDNSSQMYVENIKAHAFVTNYYMQGFFDFAYAFFENNLFRELSDDLDEDLISLSSFMETTLKNDRDAFYADDSGKKAAKSYKLLKSTRAVFAQAGLETVYAHFYPILRLIDKYYYDAEMPAASLDRYENLFAEWCRNQVEEAEVKRKTRNQDRRIISHRPYLKVNVTREYAVLVIPQQKFRGDDCDGEAHVKVTINGQSETRELDLYRSFGLYISEEKQIPIPYLFDEIIIEIVGLTEKKFRFPKANYRVFDSSWVSTGKFSLGHNYLLVKHDFSVTWDNEADVIDYTDEYRNWKYYSIKVSEETICYVGNKPLSVIGEFSLEPVFDDEIEEFEVYDSEGKRILATREHPSVSFVVDKNRYSGTVLYANGKRISIKDIKDKTVYEWPEDKNKYAITVAFDSVMSASDGKYVIQIDIPGDIKKTVCTYFLLKQFSCKLDKQLYVYDERGIVSIKKSGHDVYYSDPSWSVEYEDSDNALFAFPITDNLKSVELNLTTENIPYSVRMPVNVFSYGFSENSMHANNADYIWYKELGELLYLRVPGAGSAYVIWGHDKSTRTEGVLLHDDIFRVDISEIKRRVYEEYKHRYQYINLISSEGRKCNIALPPILRNVVIEPYFKLNSEADAVFMDLKFKGEAEVYVSVYDYHTREKIVGDKPMIEGRNDFPELSCDGFYNIAPEMVEGDEFGLDVQKTPLKPMKGVGCLDVNNLVNCRLQIKDILVDEDSLPLEYRYFIETDIRTGDDEYEGGFYRVGLKDGREDWNTKKIFGRAHIHIYQKDEEIKFSLVMFSKDEEEWLPPYFDKQRHFILGCDNHLINTTKDYDRFVPMEEDYSEYIVDLDRLRRIK